MTLYTLQLLRFVASLLVLFFHLELIYSGYKGVDVFFVISGFVMYYTLFLKSRPSVFKFIINRFTKIFFLYWVALILLYIILPYKINSSSFQTFLLIPGHYSVLGVSWSLSYELYFYFLIGTVVYLIPGKYHNSLFFLIFLMATLITFINLTSYTLKGSLINFLLGSNLWEFLLGIVAAFISASHYKAIQSTIALIAASTSGFLLLAISIPYGHSISYIFYGPLSYFLVLFITVFERQIIINKKLVTLFKVLGDSSYAIYLFGPIVIIIISVNNNFSKFATIIITVCVSVIFNQLIENNFLNWSRKVIYNRKYDATGAKKNK
jgi:exopolysaccharide production protein ExoZ